MRSLTGQEEAIADRPTHAPGGIAIASEFNEGGYPPRVEVVRPRRVTVAQRLQTNAANWLHHGVVDEQQVRLPIRGRGQPF
jgi:hypothetical protein